MNRPAIPQALANAVLYESGYLCAVCQSPGVQLHHIDEDRTNNVATNLIALCPNHHGEAHTQRDHARNLDRQALLYARTQWTATVKGRRESVASVGGQISFVGEQSFCASGILWGYINHPRVAQMSDVRSLVGPSAQAFKYCLEKGIVDESGVIIKPPGLAAATSPRSGTIYDWFDFGDDQRIHKLYTGLVDSISSARPVVHMERSLWSPERVESLVSVGDVIFLKESLAFKNVNVTPDNEHRRVRVTRSGITVEGFVDTRSMFGDTSIYVSFTGRATTSLLALVKDMTFSGEKLFMSVTPLAMGVGFQDAFPIPKSHD